MITELGYVISKLNSVYQLSTEFEDQRGIQERMARYVGAEIVYKGTINGGIWNADNILNSKLNILADAVAQANKTGKFDTNDLEKRLEE